MSQKVAFIKIAFYLVVLNKGADVDKLIYLRQPQIKLGN